MANEKKSETINPKMRIVHATIEIMREEEDLNNITVRRIAEKAQVGIGLINYHFQTKSNLIQQSIRIFINKIISKWQEVIPRSPDMKPEEHLKLMLQATAKFMADYPRISRLSIINDILYPSDDDNTIKTFYGFLPILKEICGDKESKEKMILIGFKIISLIQWIFLRSSFIKKESGFDFYDEEMRNQLINQLVENSIKEMKEDK